VERFPLAASGWTLPFVGLLAPRGREARIHADRLEVRMGLLGRADVPLGRIARIDRMRWPWWAGIGVRIARGVVAFVPTSGDCAAIELVRPLSVRAPLPWQARRLVVRADDVEGFIRALARARDRVPTEPG
jgi:hypothetical protein